MAKHFEHRELPPTEETSPEIASTPETEHLIEGLYGEVIKTHTPVDSGKEGVIYKITSDEVPAQLLAMYEQAGRPIRDETALKVLKVYSAGHAEREYRFQERAYEIVERHLEQHPEDKGKFARVPRGIDFRHIHIDDETKNNFRTVSAALTGNDVEVLVMDFIQGRDLGFRFYRWIVDHAPADKAYIVDNTNVEDFHQLQQAVSNILEFAKPKGKAVSEIDREAEQRAVNNENAEKVYAFLRRTGLKVPQAIIDQITNTRRLLQDNGVFHNDEHERNFIVDGDQVYLIDFAQATSNVPEQGGRYSIESRLADLTENYEQEQHTIQQRDLAHTIDKIANDKNLPRRYPLIFQSLDKDPIKLNRNLMIRSEMAASSESQADDFVGLIKNLVETNKLPTERAREILRHMQDSLRKPNIVRGKIKSVNIINPAMFKRVNLYQEIFE